LTLQSPTVPPNTVVPTSGPIVPSQPRTNLHANVDLDDEDVVIVGETSPIILDDDDVIVIDDGAGSQGDEEDVEDDDIEGDEDEDDHNDQVEIYLENNLDDENNDDENVDEEEDDNIEWNADTTHVNHHSQPVEIEDSDDDAGEQIHCFLLCNVKDSA
jgi:hypothetical protein